MQQAVTIDKVQEACREDLHFLCTEILGYRDWDVCHDDLEAILKRDSKRKLIMMPRGHLKTSFVTKAYVIQTLLRNPNARILIANQVWDRSREMLYEIKEFLTDKSSLPKIFGSFESNRWREDEIVIKHRGKALAAPSVGTTGVEAEMTSAHFDLIILDDLQGLNNSQTKEQRDKVKRFYRSMTALLDPGSELIVMGTRWHFDDYYNEIMENESDYFDVMVRRVVEDGKIIFPKKFNLKFDQTAKNWVFSEKPTMDYINFLKQTMGVDFHSQYMNNPIDGETQVIKQYYFRYYGHRPSQLYIALTVDPAISIRHNSDKTGMVVCGMDPMGDIYVLDTLEGKWGSPQEIINNVFLMVEKWNPNVVGMETIGFQKTLKYGLELEMKKRKNYFAIKDLKAPPTRVKNERLKALEPYYANGKVYHQHWMKELEDQLLKINADAFKGTHDDLVDAMSYQIDLLVPGSRERPQGIPVNSWQWEVDEAQKLLTPYNFFQE